jgi:hypothetical protein
MATNGRSIFYGNTVRASSELLTSTIKPLNQAKVNIYDANFVNPAMGDIIGNIIGDVIGNVTGIVFGSANPDRVITISQSGRLFDNFPDAIAYAITLNPVQGNGVLIHCTPGTYLINDTLLWPSFVDFTADNGTAILAITDPTKNIIEFQAGTAVIDRLTVSGAMNATGLVKNTVGLTTFLFCQVLNCDTGVLSTGLGAFVRIIIGGTSGTVNTFAVCSDDGILATSTVSVRFATIAFRAENNGLLRCTNTIVENCGTGFQITDSTAEFASCHCFDCGVGLDVLTDANIVGAEFNAFNCTVDLNVSADATLCKLGNSQLDDTKFVLATESNVSLNINDESGRDKYFGGATVFNIQQVNLFGAGAAGTKAPTLAVFQDDGNNTPVGFALQFLSSSNARVLIPFNVAMDFSVDFSIDFWVNPFSAGTQTEYYLISRQNTVDIFMNKISGVLTFNITGIGQVQTPENTIIADERQYIACTYELSTTTIRIYVNGNNLIDTTLAGTPTSQDRDMRIGGRHNGQANRAFNGIMDEVNFWSKALTQAEISNLYNNGNGIINSDTTDLMAGYHFDEGAGTTAIDYGPNGLNGTLVNTITYVDGLVNATTSATTGVLTYNFLPDVENELFFNLHPDAGYKDNENIFPTIHWAPQTTDIGDVVWGFEYTISAPNQAAPLTQVITATTSTDGTALKQFTTELPPFTVANYTNIVLGRVFRAGNNVADTYQAVVSLLGCDIKYVINKLGSAI